MWVHHHAKVEKQQKYLLRVNTIGGVIGVLFPLCLVGVISVQYHIDHRVHNSFAGIFSFFLYFFSLFY